MAHNPSSPPQFQVPVTGTRNFARLPCILVPDFSGTKNLGGALGPCSIHLTVLLSPPRTQFMFFGLSVRMQENSTRCERILMPFCSEVGQASRKNWLDFVGDPDVLWIPLYEIGRDPRLRCVR